MNDPMALLLHYLVLGALLFALGAAGFVVRRHGASTILSAGVMVQGAILTLIAFAAFHQTWSGQVLAMAAMAVTTVQGLVALSLWLASTSPEDGTDQSGPNETKAVIGERIPDTARIRQPEKLVEASDD